MGASLKTGNKSIFISLAGIIQKFCMKIESIPGRLPEFISSVTYVIAYIFVSFVHEPWYDEAVAWQIARCASFKDILFEIPHYEGHPPLWHLILLPFAKLGAPYELSLSIVSLLFAGVACCLIIWKSPFPRIIRLILPFTYFFFYQYGVISRPYCIMMFVFVLLAMVYDKRNTNPGIYVGLLMLLCLTSAYGILLAGGLAIVWILEMWNRQNVITFIKKLLRDKRMLWLLALFILALFLIACIMPREDTFAVDNMSNYNTKGSLLRSLLYMFLAWPAEVSMTNIYTDYVLLQTLDVPWSSLIVTYLIGLIIWIIIFAWAKSRKTGLLLIIPFVLYALTAAILYMSPHHIGIGLCFLVFWFWVSLNKKETGQFLEHMSSQTRSVISSAIVIVGSITMIISLSWNITSSVQDIFYSYASGRNEAKFIKENGLDNYRIMIGWTVLYDENGEVSGMDINNYNGADNIAPYFENNIFFNFNNGEDAVNYTTHKKPDAKETEETILKWKEKRPDVLYMYPDIGLIYEDINLSEYKLVFKQKHYKWWKGLPNITESKIYAHEDLIKELNLETCNEETYAWMSLYGN